MKFLHTADWQLGCRFGQFDAAEAHLLTEARFETVERIAALAAEREVDAVLVAGDVFDFQTVTDKVIRRLFAALSGYGGPWIIISGNHDAALPESVWTRAARLGCIPDGVRLLLTPQVADFDAGFSILAAPLTQRHTYDDVTEWFDKAETPAGHLRIGLSHGSVSNQLAAAIDSANPIAEDRAERARLDYLALGDWHGVFAVGDRTFYSGTPETDRFRNNRSGMVLEIDIDGPGAIPVVTQHVMTKYLWERWDETIAVPTDVDLLTARLAALSARHVLYLKLSGSVDMNASRRIDTAVADTSARVRALRIDSEALCVAPTDTDLADLGAGHGYLANVVARLAAARNDPSKQAAASEAMLLLARLHAEAGAAK